MEVLVLRVMRPIFAHDVGHALGFFYQDVGEAVDVVVAFGEAAAQELGVAHDRGEGWFSSCAAVPASFHDQAWRSLAASFFLGLHKQLLDPQALAQIGENTDLATSRPSS